MTTDTENGNSSSCSGGAEAIRGQTGRTASLRTVRVSSEGVQFGNAWYSHERITGYTAEQLNSGGSVTGNAYMDWLAAAPSADKAEPIDMVLHCPKCGTQHVDAPEEPEDRDDPDYHCLPRWENPPHKSHLCHGCRHVWRPADVPTNGVAAIKTVGKNDSPNAAPPAPLLREAMEAPIAVRMLTDAEITECYGHNADDRGFATRLQCKLLEVNGLRSLAEVQPPLAEDAKDALRYRWLRSRTTCDLNQRFMLPVVKKVRGSNLLRGSIAGHLDSAIDAAIAKEPI